MWQVFLGRYVKEKYVRPFGNCQSKDLGPSSLVDLDIKENGVAQEF